MNFKNKNIFWLMMCIASTVASVASIFSWAWVSLFLAWCAVEYYKMSGEK